MFTQAKLVLQSYKPLRLEKGMWFLATHHDQVSIYELGYNIYSDEQKETFIQLNGYPVEPYLYIVGNPNIPDETFLIAEPNQIAWFDEGDHSDEMHDITIKEINNILDNDGYCQIEVEEENLDDDEAQDEYINIVPVIMQDKVVIRYQYDDEDDNPDYILEGDEEFDMDDYRCEICNGTGEAYADGVSCSSCGGTGSSYKGGGRDDEPDDWDYYSSYDY